MNLTTRPATDRDKAFAQETHHLAYRDVVTRQFGQWEEAAQDQFFEKGWDPTDVDIVMVDGEPCGYATVQDRDEDIFIRQLAIRPEHQGKGVGTAFLRQVVDRAKSRGIPVRLGCLLQNRASNLYRRLGFCEFDRTETHILMEWK